MNKIWVSIVALLSVSVLTAPVFAGVANPHFIGSPTITKSITSGLTVSWKAAGLDSLPTAAFLTADQVQAQYVCENHGGNIAPGQPQVFSNVVGPTVNIMPRNGQITFTVNLPVPPAPNPSVVCPNGNWSVDLLSLTYVNVVVHLQQNSVDILTGSLGTIDP